MGNKFKFDSATSRKVKTVILSIVIAIVLAGFVIYLVESIYPSPDYNDFCGEVKVPRVIPDVRNGSIGQVECEEEGGKWINGYCDYYYKCNEDYEQARDKHRLVMFVVGAIVGLIAISVGIVLALPSVSSGLMLGGSFLIFFGTAQYWSELNNWIRTLILGVVLVILIWLGYKKLES